MIRHKSHSLKSLSWRPVVAGLLGNLGLAALKLGFGLLASSTLIFVDGLFSLMSATAFLLPLHAMALERKTVGERHPYGLGKSVFVSMVVLGLLGMVISVNMLLYCLTVPARIETGYSAAAAVMTCLISIVGNWTIYLYLKDANGRSSKSTISLCLLISRAGAWISFFVLIVVILESSVSAHFEKAAGAVLSILVFIVGLRALFHGFGGIMDKSPPEKILKRIADRAGRIKDVKDVLDTMARYTGTLLNVDVSIAVDDDITIRSADQVAMNVEKELAKMDSMGEVNVIIA